MKKSLTIICACLYLSAAAQKDTTTINDSIPILSIRDINNYLAPLRDKITFNQYQLIVDVLTDIVNKKEQELRKQKPKK